MPTLLPRTAMRLSKAAFWDFPLTPNKVRAEQEQKAEHKHFKRHGRKTERAAALRGERNEQHLWQAVSEGLTNRDREGQDKKIQSLLSPPINETSMHTRLHTQVTQPDMKTP